MENCIFCKIANGEIPTSLVYEDDLVAAFNDLEPQAPVHILIIPKEHIASVDETNKDNSAVVAHIFEVAALLAKENNISADGYRVVTNIGEAGGQTVPHLHFHVLAGRDMTWPPG